MTQNNKPKQKSLYVSIMGDPNVGKSTLLNYLAGQKISIVTHKVQTTRENIKAVFSNPQSGVQIVFTDTPGIFEAKRKLENYIVSNALNSIEGNDTIILMIDAKRGLSEYVADILQSNKDLKKVKNILAVINKVDLVTAEEQFKLVDSLQQYGIFEHFFAICATSGHGIQDLVKYLESKAYDMPWAFDSEYATDANVRSIAEEITREKVFLNVHRELPYSIKVETDQWQEDDKGIIIHQSIFVLKESQKKIVLGEGGARIKAIGKQSREEISHLTDSRVSLYLHVKVREKWIEQDFKNY